MSHISKISRVAAVLFAAACVPISSALVLDFEDLPSGYNKQNYESQGFRFSPNCHFDAVNSGTATGTWFGFDESGCLGGPATGNPSYVGPTPIGSLGVAAEVYVTRINGSTFSLTSLTAMTPNWAVVSSNGGAYMQTGLSGGLPQILSFSGPQWEDLLWVSFRTGGGESRGFDNFTVADPASSVPISPAFALLGIGLLGLARTRALV